MFRLKSRRIKDSWTYLLGWLCCFPSARCGSSEVFLMLVYICFVSAEYLPGFTLWIKQLLRLQCKEFAEDICWCPVRGWTPHSPTWLCRDADGASSMSLNNLHLEVELIKDHIWMQLHRGACDACGEDMTDTWWTVQRTRKSTHALKESPPPHLDRLVQSWATMWRKMKIWHSERCIIERHEAVLAGEAPLSSHHICYL